MSQTTNKIVNGINVTQLFDTIDAIKENTTIAKFNFRAKNKWIDGTENQTTISDIMARAKPSQEIIPTYL